jgi:ketosteroid isomerase-like protein
LEEIGSRHQKVISLLAEGKNKEALQFYTDDCLIMPPGREALNGKEGKNNSCERLGTSFT